jgi:glycosyltransferase involved in cell wall biosynthesis
MSRPSAESGALRVALVGPPLEASGGIGRLMSYALAAMPESVEVTVVDSRGAGSAKLSPLYALRAIAVLVGLRARRRVDVVHINLSSHGSFARKSVILLAVRMLGLPAVVQLHASSFDEFYEALPAAGRALVRVVLRQSTSFLVLGEHWREFAVATLRVPAEKVHVARCGVPGAVRQPATADFRICFLGRLGERKGVPTLVDALELLDRCVDGWRAVLAGDGPVEAFRQDVARRGLAGKVDLPGWLDRPAAADLLAASDVLVLPSKAEGLPVSVLEAMGAGVPVVCTAVGAIDDLGSTDAGLVIVPPDDPEALAKAIENLAREPEHRRALGDAARARWAEMFDVRQTTDELCRLWRQAHGDNAVIGVPAAPPAGSALAGSHD